MFFPPWYIRDNCFRSPNRRRGLDQVKGRAPGLSGKRSTSPANGGTGEANPLPPPHQTNPLGALLLADRPGAEAPSMGAVALLPLTFIKRKTIIGF